MGARILLWCGFFVYVRMFIFVGAAFSRDYGINNKLLFKSGGHGDQRL
jgi:hypothetical protein